MIYVLAGEDRWRLEEVARALFQKAKDSGASAQIFEAPAGFEAALAFIWRPALFEKAKFALVKKSENLSENYRAIWQNYFGASGLGSHQTLVFAVNGTAPSWLSKLADKSVNFPLLRGKHLAEWLEERAAALGIELEPGVKDLLSRYFPQDSGRISLELEKLASWKPGGVVSLQDLQTLTNFEVAESSLFFGWMDALLARNRKQALRYLAENLAQGAESTQLLATLANTFRTMLILKEIPSADSRRLLGQSKPFWLAKIRQASKHFSSDKIKKILASILRADYLTKTGRLPADQAAAEIVFEITSETPPTDSRRIYAAEPRSG